MNILRFVNSKDIREHIRNIGYEFNSLEAAWLIYQCRDATIDEKHKAWNELIEKIVVHEKEIGEGGVKTQQVDIYYKFIGCVNLRRAKADHAEIIKAEQGQADNRTA